MAKDQHNEARQQHEHDFYLFTVTCYLFYRWFACPGSHCHGLINKYRSTLKHETCIFWIFGFLLLLCSYHHWCPAGWHHSGFMDLSILRCFAQLLEFREFVIRLVVVGNKLRNFFSQWWCCLKSTQFRLVLLCRLNQRLHHHCITYSSTGNASTPTVRSLFLFRIFAIRPSPVVKTSNFREPRTHCEA